MTCLIGVVTIVARFITIIIDPLDLLKHKVDAAAAIAGSKRCAPCGVCSKVSWPGGQL